MKKRVLVVDCDLQGNCTSGLNVDKWSLKHTVIDVLANRCKIESAIVNVKINTKNGNSISLDVVGNNLSKGMLLPHIHSSFDRDFLLRNALKKVHGLYDYILIDTPPTIDVITYNGLCASDSVVVVMQLEPFALEGLDRFLKVIRKINKPVKGILFTMVSERFRLTSTMREKVIEAFGSNVFKTQIPRSVKVAESQWDGIPLSVLTPKHKVSQAYASLVGELLQ